MIELNKIYNEPCLETLAKMPDEFIDCIITSPPYWQLRDYGYEGQWGLEKTFQEYLEHLWGLMDECYRVLKLQGTAWINLGDTYSTQSGTNLALSQGRKYENNNTYLINRGESGELIKDNSLPNKCLLLIPHRFAIGCIDRGWIIRNDIIWAKRNGMPESVTDRFSKKHEYIFFMTKSEKYFFDLDIIRDKLTSSTLQRMQYDHNGNPDGLDRKQSGRPVRKGHKFGGKKYSEKIGGIFSGNEYIPRLDGKNPGTISDFWDIPTKSSGSEHYAAYNDSLLRKPVLAGCPENGIIYDPFMGTGSTAEVALRANRKFVGSEMSKSYCEIAEKRISPFLQQTKLI